MKKLILNHFSQGVIMLIATSHPMQASTLTLLDNTNGLSLANLDPSDNYRSFSENTEAYQTLIGYSFQVGSTAYNATTASLPLDWQGEGAATISLRMFFWELPDSTALTPAGGASTFYTEDLGSVSVTNSASYVTFTFTNPPLLKENTRYSVAIGTTLTTNSSSLHWVGMDSQAFPPSEVPSGSYGLSSVGFQSGFISANSGASFRSDNIMLRNFQLTGTAAIPEPASASVGLLGAVALMLRRRRVK